MRYIFIALCVFLVSSALPSQASAGSSRYASLVVHTDSGVVLHQKNAQEPRHPASLTKMMTLYLAFDALKKRHLRFNQYIPVSRKAAAQPRLSLGLKRGGKVTVRDAVNSIAVHSANDSAVVLAEAIAGSEWRFVQRMNRTARRLGMRSTTFQNATGLHHKNQVTTARDMARLIIALQRDFPKYYRLMARKSFSFQGHRYYTHNGVLKRFRGATGGKTGYIRASGYNLAASATRHNRRLVSVVMGGRTAQYRDRMMTTLLERGFKQLSGNYRMLENFASNFPVPKQKPWATPPINVAIQDLDFWEVFSANAIANEQN